MTRPTRIGTSLLSCLAVTLAGCVTVSESNPTPPFTKVPREAAGAPAKIIISPLTRIGIDTGGDQAVFLHLEFRDAAEKRIKGFGQLRVQLYEGAAPAGDGVASAPPVARSWDADLTDPVRNALSFDEMITHTYAINLGGLPEWLIRWSRHESDAPAPTLVVQFLPAAAASNDQMVRATYTLTR